MPEAPPGMMPEFARVPGARPGTVLVTQLGEAMHTHFLQKGSVDNLIPEKRDSRKGDPTAQWCEHRGEMSSICAPLRTRVLHAWPVMETPGVLERPELSTPNVRGVAYRLQAHVHGGNRQ
eukprot:2024116-Prorocentrum_lima.AAC.2